MEVEETEKTPHALRTSGQQDSSCPSTTLRQYESEQRRKLLKRTQLLPYDTTGVEQTGTSWAKMAPASKSFAQRMLPGSDKQYEDLMNRQGKASTRHKVLGGWAALQGEESRCRVPVRG